MIVVAVLIVVAFTAPLWFPSVMTVAGILAILAIPILFFASCIALLPPGM